MTNYLKQQLIHQNKYDGCDRCLNSCEFSLSNRIIYVANFVPDYIPTSQEFKWIEAVYNKMKETGKCEYRKIFGKFTTTAIQQYHD